MLTPLENQQKPPVLVAAAGIAVLVRAMRPRGV
jgi:hypothetical protein